MNTGQRLKNPHRCKVSLQNVGTKDSALPYFFSFPPFPVRIPFAGNPQKTPFFFGKASDPSPWHPIFSGTSHPGFSSFSNPDGKADRKSSSDKSRWTKGPIPCPRRPGPRSTLFRQSSGSSGISSPSRKGSSPRTQREKRWSIPSKRSTSGD